MDCGSHSGVLELSDNERRILNLVRRRTTISRAEIALHTNLTQQSVHRIISALVDRRLVVLGDALARGPGKPSPQITLDRSLVAAVGVSVGSDDVRYVAVDLSGAALCEGQLTAHSNDPEDVFRELSGTLSDLTVAGPLADRTVFGIGIAIQGYRIADQTRFITPPHLNHWWKLPIGELFHQHINWPIFVENNATCGAIAELFIGGGSGYRCFVQLSFNHGFGAGVIWDERPVLGGHGNACEIGYIYRGEQAHRSRPALGELIDRLKRHGVQIETVGQLQTQFDPSWPGLHEWIEEVTPALNLATNALTATLDPNAIFFGGEAPAALRQMLMDVCDPPSENFYGEPIPTPVLKLSEIEGDSAVFGAAMLALQNFVFRTKTD